MRNPEPIEYCVDSSSSHYYIASSNPQNESNSAQNRKTKKIYKPMDGATEYKCELCDHASFQLKTRYITHMEKQHNQTFSKQKMYKCQTCGSLFCSYYMLGDHRRKEHPELKSSFLYCAICGLSKIKCKCTNHNRSKCPVQGCNAVMLNKYLPRHARKIHKIYASSLSQLIQKRKIDALQSRAEDEQSDISQEQNSLKSEQNPSKENELVCDPFKEVAQRMTTEPAKYIGGIDMETINQMIEDVFKMRDIGFDPRYLQELEEAKQKQRLTDNSHRKL